jgi:hypothetical protein
MNDDVLHDPDRPDDDSIDDEPTTDDLVAQLVDLETQKRLWIRTLMPVLQSCKGDSHPSGRVQLALDLTAIAACERIRRICASDLPDDEC